MMTNVIEMYRAPVALPAEVKALKGWVLWKLEHRPGETKARKVPYYIDGRRRSGQQGGDGDRESLATFDRAALACSKGGWSGIGLALLPEFDITAVDFDAVIDEDGALLPEVAALVAATYSEVSPSGRGVRAFFRGQVASDRKDNRGRPQVEFFVRKGFVTVTGNMTEVCQVLGNEEVLAPLTAEIGALYAERFGQGRASAAAIEDIDPRTVREMLDAIDPDSSHDVWFRIGLGLHHQFGAEGFDLWNEWSAKGKKYPGERTVLGRWRSIRNDEANPVTIASVRQAAREAGWREDFSSEWSPIAEAGDDSEEVPLPALTRNARGEILATVDNLNKALRHEGMSMMRLGFDAFRDEVMFSRDQGANWQPFKDTDYVTLRVIMERRGFKPIGRELMRDVVAKVAEDNTFDTAQQWIGSLPAWDGVPRMGQFLQRYFGATDSDYTQAVGCYLWTALAGRVMEPGCQADMVPVLIGDQGIRKSTGVAAIAPAIEFFTEIGLGDKEDDLSRKMRATLVGEIGELRGLHSKEVEHIKQFVTRRHEVWTPKFKEFKTTFPRRLVFIGTTNQGEFLADETGNRRWLPVEVHGVDVPGIERDRNQLWAEGLAMFMLDGIAWSDAERLGRHVHAKHMITDPWEGTIQEWLDGQSAEFYKLNDIAQFALNIDAKHIARREELRIGRILRGMGYEKTVTRIGDKLGKAWVKGCPF